MQERKRKPTGSGVLEKLMSFEFQGQKLPDHELISNIFLLIIGGSETVPKAFAGAVYQLLKHPDQRAALIADPDLAQDAFWEAVRTDMPTLMLGASAEADTEICDGTKVRAGQKIMNLWASANRDEREFADPDRFDIRRRAPRIVSFNPGRHICLGIHVAQLEGRVMLQELLARIPDYEADESRAVRLRSRDVPRLSMPADHLQAALTFPIMAAAYKHLLSPGRIGTMELRNRIVHAPMSLGLGAGDGTCGDRYVAYYAERAKGGAGLINIGTVSIGYPEGSVDAKQIAASDDKFLPNLTMLADAMHAHGAKIVLQLNHNGLQAGSDRAAGRPLATPSLPLLKRGDLADSFLPEEMAALAAANPVAGEIQYRVLDAAGILRGRRNVCRRGAPLQESGHRCGRDPWRSWLFAGLVPVARDQSADRQLWRPRSKTAPVS